MDVEVSGLVTCCAPDDTDGAALGGVVPGLERRVSDDGELGDFPDDGNNVPAAGRSLAPPAACPMRDSCHLVSRYSTEKVLKTSYASWIVAMSTFMSESQRPSSGIGGKLLRSCGGSEHFCWSGRSGSSSAVVGRDGHQYPVVFPRASF